MPELHLRDALWVLIQLVAHSQNTCKEFRNFLNTDKLSYIYKNDLDKACFQHDMAYNKFKV